MKISQVIKSIQNNPDEILDSLDKSNLKKLIDYLLDKYHNENKSLVSDQLFDYIKEYYEKNKDKYLEYREDNKDNILKQRKQYYETHKDKILENMKTYNNYQ